MNARNSRVPLLPSSVGGCLLAPAASLLLALAACTAPPARPLLLTRAEASGFEETTRYGEAMAILRALDEESDLLYLTTMGTTAEGRAIPLAVLADPPVRDPSEVDRDRRPVVYIQANIHAGEVEGKEACLMLLRELVREPARRAELLGDTVLLVAPIYNADGNEHAAKGNRPSQDTPTGPVGMRFNAQNLDLNRDMIKLESPEAGALVRCIFNQWNPNLLVDCHTTNGSWHEEPITYAPPLNPLNDAELLRFNREELLSWMRTETKRREGYDAIPYGNFKDPLHPEQGWYTFDHKPRYVTNYAGFRNRLAVLVEMYAHAPFRIRVLACRAFLRSLLAFCRQRGAEVIRVTEGADRRAVAAGWRGTAPLRMHFAYAPAAAEAPLLIRGYAMEITETPGGGRRRPRPVLDKPVTYRVPCYDRFRTTDEGIPLPEAYLFPRGLVDVREQLARHGIRVEVMPEPFRARVSVYRITKIDPATRLFQGHRLERLEGVWEEREVDFPAGAFVVPAAQPLALLAAYLLEPESDDGLAAWNFLDRYLTKGEWNPRPGDYPVMRLEKSPLPSVPIPRALDESAPLGYSVGVW